MSNVLHKLLGERPMRRLAPYIYALLVIGLFFHPHFYAHVGPQLQPYAEGLTNLVIVGLGVVTYYIYKREQREFERRFLETSTYIGAMNRKLPLLQNITTDFLSANTTTAKQKARIFRELVAIACGTIAKSERGLLRFIEVGTGRTVKEFYYSLEDRLCDALTVGNKELLLCDSLSQKAVNAPDSLIIAASDHTASVRAFLIIPNTRKEISEHMSTLQAIVDQGQILSRYVFGNLSENYV